MNLYQHIKKLIKRHLSAAMIPCLLLSFLLWYIIKLGYTYTANIPVNVTIEGQHVRVNCLVEATGYRLFAHRYVFNDDIELQLAEVDAAPSVINKGNYVINPYALQNIISLRNGDLRIISVGELPEIAPPEPVIKSKEE